ncbi:MAG: GH32 C-terminal domain-containing protein [Pirellulaceae bacterium]
MKRSLSLSVLLASAVYAVVSASSASHSVADDSPLTDKTLIVWVSPANLTQTGGTALTVNDTTMDQFDGVVFAELEPCVWMPGSNGYSRTQQEQTQWPKETAGPDTFVQMAIVYQQQNITLYRNGELYAAYTTQGQPHVFGVNTAILFGQRHLQKGVNHFVGRIRDARVYAQALDQATIARMQPGVPAAEIEPWAWWDFSRSGTFDRAERFNQVKLSGGARIEDGCLLLEDEKPVMLATIERDNGNESAAIPARWSKSDPVPESVVQSTRILREKLLEDAYRPRYHFCLPEDNGVPGDPNGCFYAAGRYHLMYLYNRSGVGFCWGHISSHDLVHWRHHPDAIGPGDGDEGCFSGGAFVDDNGSAYLSYWMLWGDKGIGIARSSDRDYEHWQKLDSNPVIKSTEWGITEVPDGSGNAQIYGSADPSNIWKKDGKYFVLTGNLLVLNKYGRQPDAPASMKGDRLYLLASDDLAHWTYQGVFYARNPLWTDDSEDNMCPSFLPLPNSADGGEPSGKHLLLFISHNKGCQYYVGKYDMAADRFLPDNHGRMSWVDNTYFAPEALIDGRGRQIMWSWLTDNPAHEMQNGWSGVYGLPRSLWLGDDGTLRMAPVKELEMLRGREQSWHDVAIRDDAPLPLEGVIGDSCELEMVVPEVTASRCGIKLRMSPGGEEETLVYYDAEKKQLCFDATRSGIDGRRTLEQAPFELRAGEPLALRVFVDRSVVEVYANNRQAIGRRVFPGRDDSLGVAIFAAGGTVTTSSARAWEMMPANPY